MYPVFDEETVWSQSAFYTQSAVCSLHFIPTHRGQTTPRRDRKGVAIFFKYGGQKCAQSSLGRSFAILGSRRPSFGDWVRVGKLWRHYSTCRRSQLYVDVRLDSLFFSFVCRIYHVDSRKWRFGYARRSYKVSFLCNISGCLWF